jgi:hypothetical protein
MARIERRTRAYSVGQQRYTSKVIVNPILTAPIKRMLMYLILIIGFYSVGQFFLSVLFLDQGKVIVMVRGSSAGNSAAVAVASRPLASHNNNNNNKPLPLLSRDDYIMQRDYDKSPIVVPEYKLIFFSIPKVGCTVWKQLFRRMAGLQNWKDPEVVHDPNQNGLTYLSDFTDQQANSMMLSKEWHKALFVRDPKERFLSAYLDKAVSNFGKHMENCCHQFLNTKPEHKDISQQKYDTLTDACTKQAQKGLSSFFSLIQSCPDDAHWLPQSQRLDQKYWEYLSTNNNNNKVLVGNMETKERDARVLLETVGAWNDYGTSGWGEFGNSSIFSSRSTQLTHLTHAKHQLPWYYDVSLERQVDDYYRQDYELSILNLTNLPIPYIKT